MSEEHATNAAEPPNDTEATVAERFHEIIGDHERVTALMPSGQTTIWGEAEPYKSVDQYLKIPQAVRGAPTPKQLLTWCRDTTEALAWIHSKRVLHCNLETRNLVLGPDLRVKLVNFQGRHFSDTDEVVIDGFAYVPMRFSRFDIGLKSELFDLGCAIYSIVQYDNFYPETLFEYLETPTDVGPLETMEEQLKEAGFTQEEYLCKDITFKCWKGEYKSAEDVLCDIRRVSP